jgi:5-methylcytosine-specific restriction endonuclease McrA
MLNSVPSLEEDLAHGDLNLTQVSLLAHSLRAKKMEGKDYEAQEKREILDLLKGKDFSSTQKIVAQALDLKPTEHERTRVQQDDSVRLELTLTDEQMKALRRCQDLLSHVLPPANWAILFTALAEFYLAKKDPLRKNPEQIVPTSIPEAAPSQKRAPIPTALRRRIHQRDRVCQWQISPTMKCGSGYQLEIDHIHPVWAGGPSCEENLQLLCSTHNRLKYEKGA